jgi:phospholipid-translocating ATPase
VLISGMVIAVALDNSFTHPDLGNLLKNASSVVVYRSSPAQKAEVVTFMKRFTGGKITLAIGDGANDVNMI